MKYKLIGNNDATNVIDTILHNRGIENTEKYLNLSEDDIEDYNDLDNIQKAVECFTEHFERGDLIGILVDTDP